MLTKSQKKTYDFIKEYITTEKISPTLNEIALGISIKSRGTVSRYVQALIDYGLLAKKKGKNTSRNLALTNKSLIQFLSEYNSNNIDYTTPQYARNINPPSIYQSPLKAIPSIPLIGMIAAGQPIEAIVEHNVLNITDILKGDDLYMLKVKGDSMIEEGIFHGDYVVCQSSETANNGDIVVALIDNQEATLKKMYKKSDKILLCPANSSMAPIEYEASRVKIQGILKCQLRSY